MLAVPPCQQRTSRTIAVPAGAQTIESRIHCSEHRPLGIMSLVAKRVPVVTAIAFALGVGIGLLPDDTRCSG
jgi:hypothetical protein